jgi:hypothetical protein
VGLRCRNPPRHLSQLKAQEIPLIETPVKGIARAFNRLKYLGAFLHFKPTVGCQISTLIFEKKIMEGVSINIP